jgi:hypothetical protein
VGKVNAKRIDLNPMKKFGMNLPDLMFKLAAVPFLRGKKKVKRLTIRFTKTVPFPSDLW